MASESQTGEAEKAVKYTYDQVNDRWSRERVLVVVEDSLFAEGSKVHHVALQWSWFSVACRALRTDSVRFRAVSRVLLRRLRATICCKCAASQNGPRDEHVLSTMQRVCHKMLQVRPRR